MFYVLHATTACAMHIVRKSLRFFISSSFFLFLDAIVLYKQESLAVYREDTLQPIHGSCCSTEL